MKILFIFGDASYILTHRLSLISSLKANNNDVIIACPISSLVLKLQQKGFNIYPLHYFDRASLNPLNEVRAIQEIYHLIKILDPSLVHTVAMKPTLNGLIAVFLQGRKKAPRLVATFGGLGYLFLSPKIFIKGIRWVVIKLFNFLFRHTGAHLVLQNKDDACALTQAGLRLPGKVHMIPGSGVCPTTYPFRAEPAVDKNGPRVLYMGRLLKDKGLIELIEAIKILKNKGLAATFHIYGEPDLKNPASLNKDDLINWQAEGLITWHGSTAEPAKAYQAAHIVVLPSYREGLPKALLEAGLTGRALVATDVPGCREVVIKDQTGILIPPYKALPLAEALEKFIKEEKFRQKMGTNAHHHVMNYFSDPIILRQHYELYQNLLSSPDI